MSKEKNMENIYNRLLDDGALNIEEAREITRAFLLAHLKLSKTNKEIDETLEFAWYDAFGDDIVLSNNKDWAGRAFKVLKAENPAPYFYDSMDDPDFIEPPMEPQDDAPYMTKQELAFRLYHERGMSQRKIAEQLGVHYTTINRWIQDWKKNIP